MRANNLEVIYFMSEQNYSAKIIVLFLATLAGIFVIWYALIREQSADWISSQIVHQASPYAVSEIGNGLIINNVILNYEFRLPRGFKTDGARNLNFFMEEADRQKCEIRHYYLNEGKARGLAAGETRLIIPLRRQKLVFELVNQAEKGRCEGYLKQIKVNSTTE